MSSSNKSLRQVVVVAGMAAAAAHAHASVEVIYTEIAASPTSTVPGALDNAGQPADADFTALEDLAISHDGTDWVLKARTNQGATADTILLRGSGLVGTAFAQDGQPFKGGVAGELYDFFDSPAPAAWDDNGTLAFSARARGGLASVFEKVVVVDGKGNHTIVLQMGDAALGLSGCTTPLFGNSINSVHLLNSGLPGFVVTPITNCPSTRYPAFFRGHTAFRQCGVSTVGAFEIWDGMGLSDCGGTPDGTHFFIDGDTENPDTTLDAILAVDDQIVVKENTVIAGTSIIAGDVLFTRMLTNGDWFSRGDDTASNDWAMRNGTVVAKTGDPVLAAPFGPTENWGAVFTAFTGNTKGDWVLCGNTTNADVNIDNVMVLNGEEVIAREGDPIDLNGNGQPDDDLFINAFQANDVYLTDDGTVYFLATVRNGAGTALGDAMLRLTLGTPTPCPADIVQNGVVNVDDLLAVIGAWGDCPAPCPADVVPNGVVNVDDLLLVIGAWGNCP